MCVTSAACRPSESASLTRSRACSIERPVEMKHPTAMHEAYWDHEEMSVQVAVVGHVEWVDFILVPRMPDRGQVAHAEGAFTRAAGGGGVVAGVLAELGAEGDFFCALGRDARLLVRTDGANGGSWSGESQGTWSALPTPGEPHDSYGCGDSFAAGFTFGLAAGMSVADAAQLGAQRGALCLTRAGAP